MRKILSPKEIESKRKRNNSVIAVIMLGVLLAGTIGYGFMSSLRTQDNTDDNQDTNIRQVGDRWEVKHNNNIFYLDNSLDEVKNISVTTHSTIYNLADSKLYIASDNQAVLNEIASVLSKYTTTQQACYGPCPDNPDLPEKNCTSNLIVWQDSTENKVYQEENCIFIEGDLQAVDAFLYTLLDFH